MSRVRYWTGRKASMKREYNTLKLAKEHVIHSFIQQVFASPSYTFLPNIIPNSIRYKRLLLHPEICAPSLLKLKLCLIAFGYAPNH